MIGLLSDPQECDIDGDPEQLLDTLGDLLHAFLRGMEFFRDPSGGDALLRDAVSRTASFTAALERPFHRPYRKVGAEIRRAAKQVAAAETAWITSAAAETPGLAQTLASQAQRELDTATIAIADAKSLLVDIEAILDADLDHKLELATRVVRRSWRTGGDESPSIQDLDLFGRAQLARVTGPNASVETGYGLTFLISVSLGELVMDEDRLYRIAALAHEHLAGQPHLRLLVDDSDWQSEYAIAEDQVDRAVRGSVALANAATDDTDLVRAELLSVQDLMEGPLRFFLATFLAVHQRKSVKDLILRDVTTLLNQYRDRYEDLETDGASIPTRVASAHNQFRTTRTGVQFTDPKNPRHFTFPELHDAAIATTETLLALSLGLTTALMTSGFHDFLRSRSRDAALDRADLVAAISLASGADPATVEFENDTCAVRMFERCTNILPLLGAIEACVPTEIKFIRISFPGPAGVTHELEAPVDVLARRHEAIDAPLGDELAYAQSAHGITIDGEPFLPDSALCKLIAGATLQSCDREYSEAVRFMRTCREVANRTGNVSLGELITGTLRLVRLRATAMAPDDESVAAFRSLVKIAQQPYDSPFDDI